MTEGLSQDATDKLRADVAAKILKIGDSKLKAIQVEMTARQVRMAEQVDIPVAHEAAPAAGDAADGYVQLIRSASTLEELDLMQALAEWALADVA